MRENTLATWQKAQEVASAHMGWEGDITEGPYVFMLPMNDGGGTMTAGFIWKQSNNGTTFVVSPFEMPWLRDAPLYVAARTTSKSMHGVTAPKDVGCILMDQIVRDVAQCIHTQTSPARHILEGLGIMRERLQILTAKEMLRERQGSEKHGQ